MAEKNANRKILEEAICFEVDGRQVPRPACAGIEAGSLPAVGRGGELHIETHDERRKPWHRKK